MAGALAPRSHPSQRVRIAGSGTRLAPTPSSLRALAAVVLIAASLVCLPSADVRAAQGVQEWIEALRPATLAAKDASAAAAQDGEARPSPITVLGFAANQVAISAEAKSRLDELATALMSPSLEGYVFEIRWYADPKKAGAVEQALSERRAAAMYSYLQTRRGIMPTKVMLRWSKRKPQEFRGDTVADTLVLKVVNLGQE